MAPKKGSESARNRPNPRTDNPFPSQLSTFIFRLREKGIAKSHRPVELAEEAGPQPAGHARIDEMLVSADGEAISALNTAILQRKTKVITANLSAIETIEP